MRWCRGDIRRQIEFFDPLVTIAPKALISPPFRGGSCPKSVTHVSPQICHPCPPTIPTPMNKATKTKYLEDLDDALTALGFNRRRNHQEWKHQVDSANELWIHINFGLSIVNPSIGVNYLDLVELLPQESGL